MKKLKIFVMLLLVFCMFPKAFANTIEEALGDVSIYADGTTMNYLISGRGVQNLKYVYYNHTNKVTGEEMEIPAYCVMPNEPGVGQLGTYDVSCTELASDPKVVGIVSNGYPRQSFASLGLKDKYEAYYATKIALWNYLIGSWDINTVKVNPNCSDQDAANRVLKASKQIYNNGVTWTSTIQPTLTATPVTSQVIEDNINSNYLSQTFIVKANTYLPNGAVGVSFAEGDVPDGVKIVDANTNQPITQFNVQLDGNYHTGKFKVLYPKDSVDDIGQVQIKLSALQYRYAVYYGVSYNEEAQDYLCDTDPAYLANSFVTSSYSPEVELEEGTYLKIVKYETGTKNPVEGARFEVINPSGATHGIYTTDARGEIIIRLNITGNFTVKEISAPQGYLIGDKNSQNVEVIYNEIAELTFYNTKYGELTIEKIDAESGRTLGGTKVKVTHIESGNTQTVKTEATGVVHLEGLLPGGYEIQEITAPKGYILNNRIYTVNVTAGNVSNIVLKNTSTPSLRIIKFDKRNNVVLPNATFRIYKDASLIGEYTTDQMGEILLTDLEPGTYLAQEVDAPDGYVVDDYFQQIEVEAGKTAELVFFNLLKPGIGLVKIDSSTMDCLPNSIFRITQVGGTFSEERKTDENGRIDLSDLEPGTYQVTEIEAPEGYVIDDNIRTIKLNAGETDAQFIFTNTRMPDLKIIKVSSKTKEMLAGATFSIGKVGETPKEYRTNSDGVIYLTNLEPGIYSVIETKAPNGYILDGIERVIELFPGKLSQLVYDNDELPKLQVIKTCATSGDFIEGAKFRVNKSDGSTIGTFTTDRNGQFLIDKLDEGVYTVTEVYVPEGYILDTVPQSITLFANKTGVLQFENYPRANLTIAKYDTISNSPLENTYFEIVRKEDNSNVPIGEFITDENGKIFIDNLMPGRYLITEIKAPKGYKGIEITKEIIITEAENKVVKFTNDALSPLYILKKSEKTNEPIEGVKFRVTEMNGRLIGEYTTDHYGFVSIPELEPGWYTVREISVPNGYVLDNVPKTVELKLGEPTIVEFCNAPFGNLKIEKLDKHTGKGLAKAQFEITRMDGSIVGEQYYETDESGIIILESLEPDFYSIKEIKAPDGYILSEDEMTIEIKSGELTTVKFTNEAISGLKIIKTDQNGNPIKNVRFAIEEIDGTRIGTYKTDKSGFIYVGLNPGWYSVVETDAPDGYAIDPEPKLVEIKTNIPTVLEVINEKLSGIRIKKINSETGEGLYGVRFIIKDSKNNIVGVYTTDQDGIVDLTYELTSGKYYLEEISTVEGMVLDTEIKTIRVREGYTEEILWENEPMKGQIQIIKKSAEYNEITGYPAGTPLAGAIFEIYNTRNNKLVDKIQTDNRGIGATKPLPLGRYRVKEIQSSPYYAVNGTEFEAEIKIDGDILKYEVFNNSVKLGVTVKKQSNYEVMAGSTMRYDFMNISNTSNTSLDNFYFHDRIPTDAVRLDKIFTGTWNQRLNYSVYYKTNYNDYRLLAENLVSNINYELLCSDNALGLMIGEYITDIQFQFGTVYAGFCENTKPMFLVTVMPNLANGYNIVNTVDVGGQYLNEWQVANDTWITKVYGQIKKELLPKTGY